MRHRTVEEYSQGLALSLDDVTRLETAVQTMLTLARLEQPAPTEIPSVAVQSCSLRDVIEDALNQSKALAELKTVSVHLDMVPDVRVPIDNRDGLLLCSNILLNALQHATNGATVRIHSLMAGNRVRLTVEDQGEGIPQQDRDRVFEPFYRGDPSRSRRSGGTGLGLSICRAICERAGGSTEIDNKPTGGALVTVLLPTQLAAFNSPFSASLKVT
jgi:two-component system OmpR family sensor kinase